MVIGEKFAYGHIPKTGGDAVHAWLSQIDGLEVDPINENRKHECFSMRGIRRDIYVLSIRRLPFWALSLLHELAVHPDVSRAYGIPPGNTVRPEHALLLKADECLEQYQSFGRTVSVWLRMEHLFDDLVQFINEHIQPVTPELRRRLLAVRTKGQRSYNHDVDAFFTPDQIAQTVRQVSGLGGGREARVRQPLRARPRGRAINPSHGEWRHRRWLAVSIFQARIVRHRRAGF